MHRNPPTRREFLGAAALAAAPTPAPVRAIDAHTHFYDPSRPGGVPWPPKTDSLLYRTVLPRDFVAVTRDLNIAGTVVIEASPLLQDNQWILDLARENKMIAGFIGHLDPASNDFGDLLLRFTRNPLFRGIRLNGKAISEGLSQPKFMAGIARLAERELTLDAIGPASMFPDLMRLSDRAPKLKIVIDHLPFDRQPNLPQARNIYAKVSGVRPDTPRSAIEELWKTFGPDRLIYGSNWPVSERVAPYADVLRIVTVYFNSKSPGAAARYFRENARIAYGLTAMPQ
jgi:L-fuconolactonase